MGKRSEDMDERISLHGPDPEAVLRALLKVDPDANPDDTPDTAETDTANPE